MNAELLQKGGLSLDRLHSFCLVAKAGGVTKAARGDPARQSLYSRQIKELEEFFETELIRRKGRGIILTEAGRRLHVVALECFTLLSDFKLQSAHLPQEIVIGAGDSIIQWVLLPKLEGLQERLPSARFRFLNLPTDEAVRRVADGLIDFAVVRQGAVAPPLRSAPLGVLSYSLFVPKRFASSAQKRSGLRVMDGLPLATLEGRGTFREGLMEIARKQKVKLNIQVECSSFTLAARAVAGGSVAAILPSVAACEFGAKDVRQMFLPALRACDRKVGLLSNPRSARIRPVLDSVKEALIGLCPLSE